jgi:hypothetical protein
MKKLLFTASVLTVAAIICWAQVSITALSRNGTLSWTNAAGLDPLVQPCYTDPVYRVEQAPSLPGPWDILTNTSQTSVVLTNAALTNPPTMFYRVTWTNGQVWNYRGYDGDNLIVTGKVYLALSYLDGVPYIHGGSWKLARTGIPGGLGHRVGSRALQPFPECSTTLYFYPYCCHDTFWLVGLDDPASTTARGTWHWQGFDTDASGTFVADRIPDGY